MLASASKIIRVVVELNKKEIDALCEGKSLIRFARISESDELENDVLVEIYSADYFSDEDE